MLLLVRFASKQKFWNDNLKKWEEIKKTPGAFSAYMKKPLVVYKPKGAITSFFSPLSKSAPKNQQLIDTPAPVLTPAPALTQISVNPSSADHFPFSTPNHVDLFENPIEFEVNKNIAVIKTFFNEINFTEIEKFFTADVKSDVRFITLLAHTAKDWEKFNQV